MEYSEKEIIKDFINKKYPQATHELNLDDIFDYYAGLCQKMLLGKLNLNYSIASLSSNEEQIIVNYISENKSSQKGKEMELYFALLKKSISILKKYYTIDGEKITNKECLR